MELASEITRGGIEQIFTTGNANSHPVLQITELKKIASTNSSAGVPPRFRLSLSDGTHFQQAMIATQLNKLIIDNTVKVNSLVRLKEIICNTVQEKRIVIILNLDLVANLPAKVGNPISIDVFMSKGGAANPKPPAAAAPGNPAMHNQPAGQMNNMNNGFNRPSGFNQQPMAQRNPAPGTNGNQQWGNAPGNQAWGNQNNMNQSNINGPNNAGSRGINPSNQGAGFGRPAFGGANNSWNAGGMNNNPYNNKPGGSGIITKMQSSPASLFRPIQSINPYQNGWTIRGRCTYKSDLRKFQNSRGEGQVNSFELTDESGSIRVTGFGDAATKIVESVHMNRIYKISRGFLKQANEKFNRSTSSFEMTIDNNALLEEVDDDGTFMQIKYNFTKIANLETVEVKGNCDVVGVVTAIGPLSEIVIRSSGEPCTRRSITIADESNASVELTLWRKQAETFLTEDALQRHPILLLRNATRGDFGGVSLNVSRMTTLELDPVNIPDANKLRSWFDSGGMSTANVQSVTSTGSGGGKISGPRKSLVEARVEEVDPAFAAGNSDASVTFNTRAMITFVNTKNDLYYPSDPETKKKVIDQGNGTWMNEASGRELNDNQIQWRYIVSLKIADHTSTNWVSGFDEVGPILFGRTAQEFRDLKEKDASLSEHLADEALCRPMLFKIQVKERTWRDAKQIRYTVSSAEAVDFASESHVLLQEIASYG